MLIVGYVEQCLNSRKTNIVQCTALRQTKVFITTTLLIVGIDSMWSKTDCMIDRYLHLPIQSVP